MKSIFLTEKDKEDMKAEFAKALEKARLTDGAFTFRKTFSGHDATDDEKAHIYYTSNAFLKMDFLVQKYSSEVGWHATVSKMDDKTWLVHDVFVYDQVVTGATVNTDDEGYLKFLASLTEEQANSMFFHGHSHVNMGVFPSSTDMEHRQKLLSTAKADGFWIFQIWNKSGNISTSIYDLKNNILYDTKDVVLDVMYSDGTLNSLFMLDADDKVHKKVYSTAQSNVPKLPAVKPQKKKKPEGKHGYSYEDPYYDWDDDDLIYDGMKPYGQGYNNYNYPY